MIFDSIQNIERYRSLFGDKFYRLKENLLGPQFSENDSEFSVNDFAYFGYENTRFERHRKHVDIQLIIKGKEKIKFSKLSVDSKPNGKYDEIKDFEFFNQEIYSEIILAEGQFVIFFPDDLHSPSNRVDDEQILKRVVKIEI